ncbi:hypothetical protein ACXX84_04015, partial [Mycoplasma sp. AC157]
EKLLNIKSSRVRKILLNMINSHKLESVGENKNRKYKLKNKKHNKDLKNVKNDANKENKNLDQELIVLNFAKQQEEFKSKDIEKLLNIKSSRVRKILLNMVKNNKLISIGENKNRKYKLNK